MEDSLFIQYYYYYVIVFLCLLTLLSLLNYSKNKSSIKLIEFIVFFFAVFTFIYIGGRNSNIGTDTLRYEKAFSFYQDAREFIIRKDAFYDFLSFVFAKVLGFQQLLIFCAFIYIFGAYYGLRKIFGQNFYLPFIVFLISPYFFTSGINVMRSGVAASLFLVGLGTYYNTRNYLKTFSWFFVSVLFHISMFVPLLFFILTRYVKNTKLIFIGWLLSILVGILDINVVRVIVESLGIFEDRVGDYVVNEGERNFWTNFAIFGAVPVLFATYNVLVLKYKDEFYTWLLNGYMLIHMPYIMLLNSEYALRLGYLAEFMMPIVLLFPLLISPKMEIRYIKFRLCLILFGVFLVKAYKILVI